MLAAAKRTQGLDGSVRLAGRRAAAFSIATSGKPAASKCLRNAGTKISDATSTT
jgi:hypothetical protein